MSLGFLKVVFVGCVCVRGGGGGGERGWWGGGQFEPSHFKKNQSNIGI